MARPFRHLDHMLTTAGRIWNSLAPERLARSLSGASTDWSAGGDASRRHPRPCAGKVESLVCGRAARASVAHPHDVQSRLDEGNRRYEARFGYIFIVCATGRTATDLLERLLSRLGNEPDAELRVAAAEQLRITEIRLRRLAGDDTGLE